LTLFAQDEQTSKHTLAGSMESSSPQKRQMAARESTRKHLFGAEFFANLHNPECPE
jgi:hypothetical protein